MTTIDVDNLRDQIKAMYRAVADEPDGAFHFEMGYDLAARLGYPTDELDQVPPEAVESFAGVGHHLALADLHRGDRVVDLGSGSGMDAFLAAGKVGATGEVIGVDMTDAQLAKARRLAARDGYANTRFEHGYVEHAPVPAGWADAVISNGVINLCSDKPAVFREDRAHPQARRLHGHFRHRHRASAHRGDRLRRQPVGVLHRWRHAAGRLP